MTKKIITFSLLLIVLCLPTLAAEKTKTGILPDNPLYFVKDIANSVKTFFTFDEIKKSERLMQLAEVKIGEAVTLAEQQKPQVVGKAIKDYEKLLNRSLEILNKAKEKDIDTNNTMIVLAENILNQQESILDNIYSIPETIRPIFRRAIESGKQIYNEIFNSITNEENQNSVTGLEIKKEQLEMRVKESGILDRQNPNLQTDQENTEITSLDQDSNEQIPQLANQLQHGKPNMNENGSTQVARPEEVGSCNSKLYLCQIDCGQKIVDDCVDYAGTYMYQMLNCRGNCMKYNIFYGCGMEAGCDEPCWNNYYDHCGPNAYENCLENCEEQFN